jgi:hypothetical protein
MLTALITGRCTGSVFPPVEGTVDGDRLTVKLSDLTEFLRQAEQSAASGDYGHHFKVFVIEERQEAAPSE